jgi:redox-sensing transcriptional repressor
LYNYNKQQMSKKINIPDPTVKRLARYLHLLLHLKEKNVDVVSSTLIANELSLDPTKVRKDIQFTNIVGKPKTGFQTEELITSIETTLNWNATNLAYLIGAGSLGKAILGYKNFDRCGLKFLDAFDVDKLKVGKKFFNIEVHHISKLPKLSHELHNVIAVLTVPAEVAQEVTDLIVDSGIKAIWNFVPKHLKVPEDVIVENILLSQSLAVLTSKLAVRM